LIFFLCFFTSRNLDIGFWRGYFFLKEEKNLEGD